MMFLLPTDAVRESSLLTDAGTGQRWSGHELANAVEALASSLQTSRKKLGFVLCRNDVATVISYLAAIEAGHAVALLDAGLSHLIHHQCNRTVGYRFVSTKKDRLSRLRSHLALQMRS